MPLEVVVQRAQPWRDLGERDPEGHGPEDTPSLWGFRGRACGRDSCRWPGGADGGAGADGGSDPQAGTAAAGVAAVVSSAKWQATS
jgi:hypothetical protein